MKYCDVKGEKDTVTKTESRERFCQWGNMKAECRVCSKIMFFLHYRISPHNSRSSFRQRYKYIDYCMHI